MRLCRKFATLAACVGLFAGGQVFAAKQEDKPKQAKEKKAGGKKKKDGKKAAADSQEKGKLSLPMIVKGHDAIGLKIPYFDTDGKLQMVFNIDRASRIDDERVSMAEMQLETFGDDGQSEMTIDLPKSVFNLETGLITTTTNVTIRRSDFEITGQAMVFNTKTKQGKLSGNVRMLIYDLGEMGIEPSEKKETTTR